MASDIPLDVHTTPAGLAPPGVTSNLTDPRASLHVIGFSTFLMCLALPSIAVGLRGFTKLYVMKEFRAEDYALVVAQLGFIPWVATALVAPGLGLPLWEMSLYTAIQLAKIINYLAILYYPLVFFAKLSVLLQLQHIFVLNRRQPIFFIIQAQIWTNCAFYLAYMFVNIFVCVPHEKLWDSTVPGHCSSLATIFLPPAAFNILSDCLILGLPLILIFRLQMDLTNKIAIAAIFSSGFFTIALSILRLWYTKKLAWSDNLTVAIYPVALLAAAELAVVIIAATLPIVPRLYAFIRTNNRRTRRHVKQGRKVRPYKGRRPRQPMTVETFYLTEDTIPLKGNHENLSNEHSPSLLEEHGLQKPRTAVHQHSDREKALPEIPYDGDDDTLCTFHSVDSRW